MAVRTAVEVRDFFGEFALHICFLPASMELGEWRRFLCHCRWFPDFCLVIIVFCSLSRSFGERWGFVWLVSVDHWLMFKSTSESGTSEEILFRLRYWRHLPHALIKPVAMIGPRKMVSQRKETVDTDIQNKSSSSIVLKACHPEVSSSSLTTLNTYWNTLNNSHYS